MRQSGIAAKHPSTSKLIRGHIDASLAFFFASVAVNGIHGTPAAADSAEGQT